MPAGDSCEETQRAQGAYGTEDETAHKLAAERGDTPSKLPSVLGVDLQIVGFGFHLAWLYLTLYRTGALESTPAIASGEGLGSPFYLTSAAALACTLLFPLVAPKWAARAFRRPRVLATMAVATALGSLVYGLAALAGFGSALPPVLAGGILTGVGSGAIATRWVDVLRRKPMANILESAPTVLALAIALGVTVPLVGDAQTIAIAVLPLATCWFLTNGPDADAMRLDAESSLPAWRSRPSRQRTAIGLLAAGIVLFGAATGFLSCFDFVGSSISYTTVLYLTATVALVAVSALAAYRDESASFAIGFMAPSAIVVCLLIVLWSSEGPLFPTVVSSVSEIFIEMLLMVLVALAARWQSFSALRAFAFARIAYAAVDFLARTITLSCFPAWGEGLALQTVGTMLFLGVELLVAACVVIMLTVSKSFEERVSADMVRAMEGAASQEASDASRPSVHPAPTERTAGESNEGTSGSIAASQTDQHEHADDTKAERSHETSDVQPPLRQHGRFKSRLQRFASLHDLSPREMDVTEQLVKGLSSARIQEELHIAAGTVNYHTRNIYQKCGVHTKQDLIDLFDNETH